MTTVAGTPITTNCDIPKPQDEDVYEFDLSQPEQVPRVAFANLSLNIPGLREPYIGYHGGINKAAKNLNPEKGLLCILNPYLDMEENDFVELFFGSATERAAFTTVSDTQASAGLSTSLYVSTAWLEYGPVSPCFFRVTRAGGGTAETDKFSFFVDDIEPAGPNPDTGTYHDYMTAPQLEQHIIDNGVQPEDAQMGVKIQIPKYPNRPGLNQLYNWAARDTIWLTLNGHAIQHVVTEGEATGTGPITITAYSGTWNTVGYGDVIIQYYVIDEAGNKTVAPSPLTIVESFVGNPNPLLAAPFIAEVDDEGKVDIHLLDGEDATIVINVPGNGYLKSDVIKVFAVGYTAAGTPVEEEYTGTVSSVFINLHITLSFKYLEKLVGGSLRIRFERIRAGVTPNRRSKVNVYEVIGDSIPVELPPARILQAPDGNIPVDSASITIWIDHYTGQGPFDAVTVILIGTHANGAGYYREVGPRPAGTGNIIFNLANGPDGDIARLEGGTLDVRYTVTNEAGTRSSQVANFDVGELVPSLPVVEIDEAPPPDYVFNPSVSLFGATVLVKRNSAFTLGSIVTLHFEGSAAGGSTIKSFPITNIWVGKDLYFDIERTFVVANLDKSARIYYTLNKPNERTRISHAVDMRVGAPLNLPVPEILESTIVVPGQSATMNPAHVLNPPVFTYRVRYTMLNSDLIQPYFTGRPGLGTPTITPKYGNAAAGFVDFQIGNSAIAANLDTHATVEYRVTRGTATLPSDPLDLEIQALPNSVANVVSIPQAIDGEFNPHISNSVQILNYPFMKSGQAVWIDLDGEEDHELRTGAPVSVPEANAKKIDEAIPISYQLKLSNNSDLDVRTLVSLDGTNLKSSATALYSPSYVVKRQSGIIKNITLGSNPLQIELSHDGRLAYVTNYGSHTISVVNTLTHLVVATISGFSAPYRLKLHPDGVRLFVGNLGAKTVSVVNTATNTIASTITGFNSIFGIAFNTSGSLLYVSCNYDAFVYIHNITNYARLNELKVFYPTGLDVNPEGTRLYAASRTVITMISTVNNGSLLGDISGTSYPRDIRFSPHNFSAPKAYITNRGSANQGTTVLVLNSTTNKIDKTITGFNGPNGIAFNPITPTAYISEVIGNVVRIIDTNTDTISGTISGFNEPDGIAISHDGAYAYVCNSGSTDLSVVAL